MENPPCCWAQHRLPNRRPPADAQTRICVDGRFTFAGQGRFFGRGSEAGGSSSGERQTGFRGRGGSFGGGGAGASFGNADRTGKSRQKAPAVTKRTRSPTRFQRFDPRNPRNYSIHVVRRGESLTSIASTRKGLKAADLAALNGISAKRPLRIGQRLKLPNQSYLDAGKEARDKFLALEFYRSTHGGRLPPDPANPPSIDVQIEAAGVRTVTANNHDFDIDVLNRPRRIRADLELKPERRSKRAQSAAGKPNRLPKDDGGHFIAARFNGPRAQFNHFAQNRGFNRGEYRVTEDQWAKALRAGKTVSVEIIPHYEGVSRRPHRIDVIWYVGGERFSESFANEAKGN
jgi:LysM repeat protein